MERTQEQKRALFDAVIADMETGLSCLQACKKNGIPDGSFHAIKDSSAEYAERYARAHETRADIYFDKIFDIALAPPVSNEFGVDKGDVELRKMQAGALQWALGKMSRKYSEKAHDESSQKPLDIGSVTVNLIQDSRPKE